MPLPGLLRLAEMTVCADRRDRVYALRALEEFTSYQGLIPVDYDTNISSLIVWMWVHRSLGFRRVFETGQAFQHAVRLETPDLLLICSVLRPNLQEILSILGLCHRMIHDAFLFFVQEERYMALPVWHESTCWYQLSKDMVSLIRNSGLWDIKPLPSLETDEVDTVYPVDTYEV